VSCWRGQRGPSSGHEVLIGRVRGSGRSIYDVYILLEDVEVLRRLSPEPFAPAASRLTLEGTARAEVLERMLRTGRCDWLDKDTPDLERGDSRAGTPAWEIAHGGHPMDFEDDTDAPVVKDGGGLLRIHRDSGADTRG